MLELVLVKGKGIYIKNVTLTIGKGFEWPLLKRRYILLIPIGLCITIDM